ncbi:MAG: cell division protein FtsX [Succinivibrionaceae bacterium]
MKKNFLPFSIFKDLVIAYSSICHDAFLRCLFSIFVLAIAGALPLFLYLLLINIQEYSKNNYNGNIVYIYVDGKADALNVSRFKDDIELLPYVDKAIYISQNDGKKIFEKENGINIGEFFDDISNPIPHTIEIFLNDMSYDNLHLLENRLKLYNDIDIIKIDKNIQSEIDWILQILWIFVVFVCVIVLSTVVLVIVNTVSNRIIMYKNDIELYKLLGASNYFICKPYTCIGFIIGVMSTIMMLWFLSIITYLLQYNLSILNSSTNQHFEFSFYSIEHLIVFSLFYIVFITVVSFFVSYKYCRKNSIL